MCASYETDYRIKVKLFIYYTKEITKQRKIQSSVEKCQNYVHTWVRIQFTANTQNIADIIGMIIFIFLNLVALINQFINDIKTYKCELCQKLPAILCLFVFSQNSCHTVRP